MMQVAERLLELFEIRDGGALLKMGAHGDDAERLRDLADGLDVSRDFAYDEMHSALDELADLGEDYDDDAIFECSDADVYPCDLNKWMAAHWGHQGYVDEALSEFGRDARDITQLIAMGQSRAKERIRFSVRDLVREMAEELEDEEE